MPRRSSFTSRVATSTPSSRIRPDVGSMSRLTILSDVVFPQPDGPTRTQIFPAGISRLRSLTAPGVPAFAARWSYVFVTWSKATVAARWLAGLAADIGQGSSRMPEGYAIPSGGAIARPVRAAASDRSHLARRHRLGVGLGLALPT